jgi:hypothetical protein
MVFFLVLSAGFWGLGWYLGTPRSARWIMIGLLYVAIVAVAVGMPEGNPLRVAIGGTTAEWLTVGALAGAAWAYAEGLKRLRTRVRPENRPVEAPKASAADQLRRQARHITLREIGGTGQKRLGAAKVLVVGAGGLGSPALQYLAAAGVGTIGVIDDDAVEVTNLQRQVIHTDDRIGHAEGLLGRDGDEGAEPGRGGPALQPPARARDRRGALRRLRPDPRRDGQLRHALPREPRGRSPRASR